MAVGLPALRQVGAAIGEMSVRERLAFAMVAATSVQAAFLVPYAVLVPGERANLFTALMCWVCLVAAFDAGSRSGRLRRPAALGVSVLLPVLLMGSAIASDDQASSAGRGFAVIAPALGGFWSSRLLVTTAARRALLLWLAEALLVGMTVVALVTCLWTGTSHTWLDVNPHPFASRMLLLCFAPVALVLSGRRSSMLCGALTLAAAAIALYLSALRSMVVVPWLVGLGLATFAATGRWLRLRVWFLAAAGLCGVWACLMRDFPDRRLHLTDYEPVYYRLESYPFSLHIAAQRPVLGIGLRMPRDGFLPDYRPRYPFAGRGMFEESVSRVVSSENVFLTLLVDAGIPFTVLYVGSLIYLLDTLRLGIHRREPAGIPPLAVLAAVLAATLHFLVFDGLLHPQVGWFYHLLLGLAVPGADEPGSGGPGSDGRNG